MTLDDCILDAIIRGPLNIDKLLNVYMTHFFRGQSLLFLVLSALTGLINAFINPIMSYYLVEGLHTPPVYIGVYTVTVTLSGLILSQWLGKLADMGVSSRVMYIIATACIAFTMLVFIVVPSFWWILAAGVLFMSVGSAAMPQMLTLGRQWAGSADINIVQFNSLVRAAISLAWILGPPLAFSLVAWFGFSGSFFGAAIVALISVAFVWKVIPEQHRKSKSKDVSEEQAAPLSFWILGAAVAFGMLGNLMYSSALPLYTLNELKLPSHVPGLLMGLVAALEIPIMLLAGRLAGYFSKGALMSASFGFGMVFYIGIFNATEIWQFVALQFVNAIFYGLFAGVGLTLMQDQLPKRIGFTSAFYSNAMKIGMMAGTAGTGLIGQFFSFQHAMLGALLAAFLGLCSMVIFKYLITRKDNQKDIFEDLTCPQS